MCRPVFYLMFPLYDLCYCGKYFNCNTPSTITELDPITFISVFHHLTELPLNSLLYYPIPLNNHVTYGIVTLSVKSLTTTIFRSGNRPF